MKYGLFFLCLLYVMACSKSETEPANSLVGTWQLTRYCKPTSTSACTDVTIPTNKHVFVTFGRDGQFNEFYENTKPIEYAFLGCGNGTYQIEGNNIRVVAICMSSLGGKLMPFATINPNLLVLKPFDTGEYTFVRQQ